MQAYIAAMDQLQRPSGGLGFIKMHGAGNDFVVIDSRAAPARRMTPALARALGDRNRGVGFDQLAEILPHQDADYRLDFWNADGSQAGACGNASRCVADLMLHELGRDRVRFATGRGMLEARRDGGAVHVNMGPPQLDWDQIPLAHKVDTDALPLELTPAAVGMATRIACSSSMTPRRCRWKPLARGSNTTRCFPSAPTWNSPA